MKYHTLSSVTVTLTWLLLIVHSASAQTIAVTRADIAKANAAPVAQRLHIDVVVQGATFPVQTRHGLIAGADARPDALDKYSELFAQEFSLYPEALIRKIRLKRIIFCTQLEFAGQRRNAIPDFENDTLYLEVQRGSNSELYMRKVIHHELFHIIDFQDDGRLYQDERWARINPDTFAYGSGGRNAQEIMTTSQLSTQFPGFLNHYSTTGVEEDKAEVFANLLVDPDAIKGRTANDQVLAAKVELMQKSLSDFCPEMNEKFWANATSLRSPHRP